MGVESGICHVGACPVCGREILPPFSRQSGPVPFVHHRRGARSCRLIVWPDPTGYAHHITPVPHDQSLEQALSDALQGDPDA